MLAVTLWSYLPFKYVRGDNLYTVEHNAVGDITEALYVIVAMLCPSMMEMISSHVF